MREEMCKKADIAVIGFSVAHRSTFNNIDDCLEMARRYCKTFVAVGTMIDMVDSREVSTEEAREHFECTNPPIHYIETSAKTGENVREVFEYAIREWRDHCGVTKSESKKDKCIIS